MGNRGRSPGLGVGRMDIYAVPPGSFDCWPTSDLRVILYSIHWVGYSSPIERTKCEQGEFHIWAWHSKNTWPLIDSLIVLNYYIKKEVNSK